jgi:hypothetical protein
VRGILEDVGRAQLDLHRAAPELGDDGLGVRRDHEGDDRDPQRLERGQDFFDGGHVQHRR